MSLGEARPHLGRRNEVTTMQEPQDADKTTIGAVVLDRRVMPPEPPGRVSPDGREIWDWAAKLGQQTALLQKRRDLQKQISSVQGKCGSCTAWLTRACPRRTHSNKTGRNSDPGMNMPACHQFVMTQSSMDMIERWQHELAEVRAKLSAA